MSYTLTSTFLAVMLKIFSVESMVIPSSKYHLKSLKLPALRVGIPIGHKPTRTPLFAKRGEINYFGIKFLQDEDYQCGLEASSQGLFRHEEAQHCELCGKGHMCEYQI
jgi:hypothetical protein